MITPENLFGNLILGWLAPMAFLSSLALVLSTLIGTRNSMMFALLAWLVDWGSIALLRGDFIQMAYPVLHSLAAAYAAFFGNPVILFTLAGLLGVIAFWLAGRRELSILHLA